MHQIIAIVKKDLLQWTRRPLYFISSVLLGILIMWACGNTISGANHIPFGVYDPDHVSGLSKNLRAAKRFVVTDYTDLDQAKRDLAQNKITVLAEVSQDPLEDEVTVWTEGRNPLINQQMSAGLLSVLSRKGGQELNLPLHTRSLVPSNITLRDYVTPGLAAYLCYVIAGMNIGFSWIYEWMEKTYRHIALAPHGIKAAIAAKTCTVVLEASVVLWLALLVTSPLAGFTLGHNPLALAFFTVVSMFTFTGLGLAAACFLPTIRIYTMTISIAGVALLFMSGVVVPIEAMPDWESLTARLMPMYYAADAFKGVILGTPAMYVRDCVVLLCVGLAGLAVASHMLTKRLSVT